MNKRGWILWTALLPVCFTTGPANAAYNRHVMVINSSSYSILALYASNEDSNSWEENMLHGRRLAPGGEVNVNVDDGTGHCVYDFKAVMRDGTEVIRRSLNVCYATSWTITD